LSGRRSPGEGRPDTLSHMGLTIHYQGQLLSDDAYARFIEQIQAFAAARPWPVYPIDEPHRVLARMLQPEDPDADEVEEIYEGPTRGLTLMPHLDCEPLAFEFDRDLFMQDYCKTQFAGPETHAQIIDLFRTVEPLFAMLDVQDEAEFWENPSREELVRTFAETSQAIAELAAEDPGSSVGVVTPSGRILDILAE
jgi:hypothetical protein